MYLRNIFNKNEKIVKIPIDIANYKSLENYLEDQGEKGWIVEEIEKYKIRFIKSEPQKKKYFVRLFESKNKDDSDEEFNNKMENIGYKAIKSEEPYQLYVKDEYSEHNNNIEEDDKEILKTIFKVKIRVLLLTLLVLMIIIVPRCIYRFNEPMMIYISMGEMTLISVIALSNVIPFLRNWVVYFRNKKRLDSGDDMEYRPYSKYYINPVIYQITIFMLLIYRLMV